MCVPPFIARQQLGKDIPHGKEELLEASFSVQSMSYQRKASAPFFLELLVSVIHVCTTNTESMITIRR
jgi:hypothetical protein